MMFKKIIALMMIGALSLSLFACGKNKAGDETKAPATNADASEKTTAAGGESIELGGEDIEYTGKLPSGLKAQKIGTITDNVYIYAPGASYYIPEGVHYKAANGMYGIMSLDGKTDTGAIYTAVTPKNQYFCVSKTTSVEELADLNCVGLVDATGKVLIPLQYASLSCINERYVQVCTIENVTDKDNDNALIYMSNNEALLSLYPDEDDIYFSGKWEIYDLTTGKTVPGVSGTRDYVQYAYGNVIKYITDEGKSFYVNENGETLENLNYFDNGCYVVENGDTYAFCSSDGKTIFTGSTDDYVPQGIVGEYIKASKYTDGTFSYALMDMSGKIVSAEFDSSLVSKYGNLYTTLNYGLYTIGGKNVLSEKYDSILFEEIFGFALSVTSSDKETIIDVNGNAIISDDSANINNFVAKKNTDDGYYCYSHKDKDYTIKGFDFAPWLVKNTEDYSSYSIYDTISGEKIIDGYKNYDYAKVQGTGIYIYAKNADGSTDIYLVK